MEGERWCTGEVLKRNHSVILQHKKTITLFLTTKIFRQNEILISVKTVERIQDYKEARGRGFKYTQ